MSNYQEIQDKVKGRLNFEEAALTSRLGDFVKDAIRELETAAEWWFLDLEVSFNTALGQAAYSLTTLAPYFVHATSLWLIENSQSEPLPGGNLQELTYKYGGGTNSRPVAYAVDVGSGHPGDLTLFPTPDAAYAMMLYGRQKLAPLVNAKDVNFLTTNYALLVELQAAWLGFDYLKDYAAREGLEKPLAREFNTLWQAHWDYTLPGRLQLIPRLDAGRTSYSLQEK